jgi:multicomponent Na+:H+ antiporter subunit G
MVGLFKFKTFYGRLLNNALIDSVAFIFLIAALVVKSGWTSMSLKLVVIGVFFLLTNPVVSQMIAHSAHKNTAMEDDDHDLD